MIGRHHATTIEKAGQAGVDTLAHEPNVALGAPSQMNRPRMHLYRCSNPHAAPHCFPDGAFEATPSGFHVHGVDRLYIELPDIGSHASPQVTMMRRACDAPLYAPKMWGMRESSGYAVADDTRLWVYPDCNKATPSATLTATTAIRCVASSRHTVATGHKDGVRLWSLPDLGPLSHVHTGAARRLALSADGSQLVVHDDAVPQRTSVWNTHSMACIRELACNASYFDDARREIVCSVRFDGFEYLDWMGRLTPHGNLKFEAAWDTVYKRIYVPSHNQYLCIGYDQSITVTDSSAKTPRLLVPPHFFGEELIGDAAVSQDGRWLAVLLERGDTMLWDLTLSGSLSEPTQQAGKSFETSRVERELCRVLSEASQRARATPTQRALQRFT